MPCPADLTTHLTLRTSLHPTASHLFLPSLAPTLAQAVAFPVASTVYFNTQGHWPDLSENADRATILGFIFAGANVAR